MRKSPLALASFLAMIAFAATPALAQSGGPFDLSWSTIGSGGTLSAGGTFKLASSIGQPEASAFAPSGGTFSITPGFLQESDLFPVPVTLSALEIE